MATQESARAREQKNQFPRLWLNRRQFLALMLGTTLSTALEPISVAAHESPPLPSNENGSAAALPEAAKSSSELASVLSDLDNGFVSSHIHSSSRIFDQRSNPDSQVSAAEAEKLLDEPASQLLSTEIGTELDAQGNQVEYREYVISYQGQEFTARARAIQSEEHGHLHYLFSESNFSDQFVNRPVTMITFNSSAPATSDMNKVTVYFVQSYSADDPSSSLFALNPVFYEEVDSQEAPTQFELREEYTALQFAQAFHPRSVQAISESAGVKSFNSIRQKEGGRLINNSSVVMSRKYGSHTAVAFDPHDDFYSDIGAIFNTKIEDSESMMHDIASIHAHEVGHGTSLLYYENDEGYILSHRLFRSIESRDNLQESWANMCRARYYFLMGDEESSRQLYDTQMLSTFFRDQKTTMHEFKKYQAMLFALLIVPYYDELATYLSEPATMASDNDQVTLENIHEIQRQYLLVKDQMILALGSDVYMDAWQTISEQSPEISNELFQSHFDIYAPLVFARLHQQSQMILEDPVWFMREVVKEVEQRAFAARVKLIQDLITENPEQPFPYVQGQFDFSWKQNLLTDSGLYQPLTQPKLNESVQVSRQIHPLYFNQELTEDSPEYLYRKFYPYYYMHKITEAPQDQEFTVTKTVDDEDFELVVIQADEINNNVYAPKNTRRVVKNGETVVIHPDKKSIIAILDKRKEQIEDDLSRSLLLLFTITTQKRTTPLWDSRLNIPSLKKASSD